MLAVLLLVCCGLASAAAEIQPHNPAAVQKLEQNLYAPGVLQLPEMLREIGDEAFSGTSAQMIILPETVTTIGDGAFSYNEKLRGVYLPETVKITGKQLFEGSEKAFVSGAAGGTASRVAADNLRPFHEAGTVPKRSDNQEYRRQVSQADSSTGPAIVAEPHEHHTASGRRMYEIKPAERRERTEMHFLDEYFP